MASIICNSIKGNSIKMLNRHLLSNSIERYIREREGEWCSRLRKGIPFLLVFYEIGRTIRARAKRCWAENSLQATRESRTTLDIATNRFFQLQLESTGPISRPLLSFSLSPFLPFSIHQLYIYLFARPFAAVSPYLSLPLHVLPASPLRRAFVFRVANTPIHG